MAAITAAAVKALREKTNLPMMECKKALEEAGGDEAKAIETLRKAGKKTMESRSGRETNSGRVCVSSNWDKKVGVMVEVLCESAPVANSEDFQNFCNDLLKQLAEGPGANSPDDLLAQPSPGKKGQTLRDQLDDMTNRIREVITLNRILRINAACGGYGHHTGATGVLLEVEGGNAEAAKDICMHIAAMRPQVLAKEDLPADAVEKEREILMAAARQEGKPENILAKMVEGRLKNFYAERVLLEQPFVKEEKKTVGIVAKEAGMKVKKYVLWELGKVDA